MATCEHLSQQFIANPEQILYSSLIDSLGKTHCTLRDCLDPVKASWTMT
jgi:hypothetical protein